MRKLTLEVLESRLAPAVAYTFYGAGMSVLLSGTTAGAGITVGATGGGNVEVDGADTGVAAAGVESFALVATVGSNAFNLTGVSDTDYIALASASLRGFVFADTFLLGPCSAALAIVGSSGIDRIDTSAVGATIAANITGVTSSTLSGGVNASFSQVEHLTTGSGDDVFTLGSIQGLSGKLEAGTGTDTLSYAAYTSPVVASLSTGAATKFNGGLAGGISGIEILIGGTRNDILVGDASANVLIGNAGNDTLSGLSGHDILIGGNGKDSLDGGNGNDLLIGGYTSYDGDAADLVVILSGWSGAATLSDGIAVLTDGFDCDIVFSGIGKNVFNDASLGDTLTGGSEDDWFIYSYNDIRNDFGSGDQTQFHL